MIDYNEQSKLFEAIGRILKRKIEVYLIGGSAMLFYNAKKATKDIDIVTASKPDFNELIDALKKMGFYEKPPFINIKYNEVAVDKPKFMILKDWLIDIFLNKIVCFVLTDTMKSRATQSHEYSNLIVKIISPEDIILLKCATEREGDRIDAKQLIDNYNINWYTIIEEAGHQSRLGQDLFVVYLYDFLGELKEDLKADITLKVIREIRMIGEKAMIKLIKEKEDRRKRRGK